MSQQDIYQGTRKERIKRAYFANGVNNAVTELTDQVIQFTKGTGAKGAVVGLSGGIDSTTVAFLCKKAFDKYNLENPDNKLELYGLIMPSAVNSYNDEKDGIMVAKKLGIEFKTVPIEPIAKVFTENLEEINNKFHKGNLYSELRAVVLSRVAAEKNYRVMGTGNRDEDYVLGYFTKRGDGAVDNNILGNVPKRLVKELALELGVPGEIINRKPTAGLWEEQTDEGELGYAYDLAEIIKNGFDQGLTKEKISEITGFKEENIQDVQERHIKTQHKREVPMIGKVNLEYAFWEDEDGKS